MQTCASMRLGVKWNIGLISSVPFETRNARSTTHRPGLNTQAVGLNFRQNRAEILYLDELSTFFVDHDNTDAARSIALFLTNMAQS